ncbi:hypothetical protein [Pseudomonas fluorescens]|uniref:hypothetical protein n=1 Tax=Pseudomonas fluorescens TaxID=294 RepID=UPI0028640863|nr:hypothetical protein [Pseudomonas fluorescens]MDR6162375.1 hypothetical protein [Pseudomonas fluorescens]
MINLFWRLVAKLVGRPAIADWLIARAKFAPYQHIMSAEGTEVYMGKAVRRKPQSCMVPWFSGFTTSSSSTAT